MKDNFWEMGDTGPCGPCSEIHIDLTPDCSGGPLVNAGDARVIELWNLVFIQFNRATNGQLSPLPAKHVDTGMGFERLCAVLQAMQQGVLGATGADPSEPQASACANAPDSGSTPDTERSRGLKPAAQSVTGLAPGAPIVVSNYDTDVFAPLFAAIQNRTGAPPYKGTLPNVGSALRTDRDRDSEPSRPHSADEEAFPEPQASACANTPDSGSTPESERSRGLKPAARPFDIRQVMVDVSYRVIADHVRCLVFALTDGAIPSNEGRGYVLRRILRRAVRYARQYMDVHEPFLCDLVPTVVEHMADAFPELRTAHGGRNVEHVADLIRDEEASFVKTLDRGIKLFEEAAQRALQSRARKKAVPEPSRAAKPSRARKEAGTDATFPLAYLITFTTYGTWLHGAEKGSVDKDHNIPGTPVLDADDRREMREFTQLKHEPVTLDEPRRAVVEAAIHEVASHRGWIIRALNVRTNHVHVVVSADASPERVMTDFKSYATRRLKEKSLVSTSGKVWTRHASTRYLWDEESMIAAGRYVCEGQGADLPGTAEPLPYGRGSVQSTARVQDAPVISGEDAFKLHDTYGFPIDLTEQMAEEQGMSVDIGEFERLMKKAKDQARAIASSGYRTVLFDYSSSSRTDDSDKYDRLELEANLLDCTTPDDRILGQDSNFGPLESYCTVLLDRTPFYAEQGGQVGDVGIIANDWFSAEVKNTVRQGEVVLHICEPVEIDTKRTPSSRGPWPVRARVSHEYRLATMKNHTATHLLNWALREVLGGHVQQKGSLVDPEKTRFDFSHHKPLTLEELQRIEDLVNERINQDLPVYTKVVDQKEAREINTLRAVFGEKYPDQVRVVSVGADIDEMLADPKNPKWMNYPVEFCGGTHLKRSSEAERFVIVSEEAVAKGIRRVVGITGDTARRAIELGEQLLVEADTLETAAHEVVGGAHPTSEPQASACANTPGSGSTPESERSRGLKPAAQRDPSRDSEPNRARKEADLDPDGFASAVSAFQQKVNEATVPVRVQHQLRERLATLQDTVKKQQKQAASVSGEAVMDRVAELLKTAENVGGVTVVVGDVPPAPADKLRSAIDWVRNKTQASVVLLATVSDGKVTLLAGMSKAVVEKGVKAGDLIREVAPLVGGKGGGRPDMAQGGGNDPDGLQRAMNRTKTWIATRIAS